MYGNQTHLLISNNLTSAKITSLREQNLNQKNSKLSKVQLIQFATILLIFISLSHSVFAGSKNPKLAGGNGNATGRSN